MVVKKSKAKKARKPAAKKKVAKKVTKKAKKKPAAKKKAVKKAVKKKVKKVIKKKAKKKPAAKKKAVKKKEVKISVGKKALNKSQVAKYLADVAGIKKKEVDLVLEGVANLIQEHLKKGGPGQFVLPGMAKFKVVRKPATKARRGINPFTGEPTIFAAKPARNVVKIRPLKKLKEKVA